MKNRYIDLATILMRDERFEKNGEVLEVAFSCVYMDMKTNIYMGINLEDAERLLYRMLEFVEEFLNYLDSESIDKFCGHALLSAIRCGCIHAVEFLLKKRDININFADDKCQNAIVVACANGDIRIIEFLLNLNDDRFNPCAINNLPITIVTTNNNINSAKILLNDCRVNPFEYDDLPFVLACSNKCIEIAELFLPYIPVNTIDITKALETAYEYNCVDILRILIRHPLVDPSANCNRILMNECRSNNASEIIVELLLQHPSIDPSINNFVALELVCQNNQMQIVNLFLHHPKINPSDPNNTLQK